MSEPGRTICGYAAIVGRPNVGKSTLLNALVGQKVSIVTPRPQTTRQRILGIETRDDVQIVFIDTPGLHRRPGALNQAMNRAATVALADPDVVVMVSEALRWTGEDDDVLAAAAACGRPVIAAVNKVDRVHPKSRLLPWLERLAGRFDFAEIVPVSATRGTQLDALRQAIVERLPEGPFLFDPGQVSDRGLAFRVGEAIREKLMLRLRDEVPYGLAVEVERLDDSGPILRAAAVIWVERASHKAIVIGKGGGQLKESGRAARLSLERMLGRKVHLELWVRVREHWTERESELTRLGLDQE